ncbi:MAG: BatA domain-containing protein [bacterium]
MLNFLSPFWFFALLTLAVPFIIHLFNRKEGKRVKIGSLRFLEASQSHTLRSIRLHEILLLVLRALLLVLLVMILARPVLVRENAAADANAKGWVLVSPEALENKLDGKASAKIDSLVNRGHELRLFAHGFPEASLQDSASGIAEIANYWSLLREADTILPRGAQISVFAPRRIVNLQGERPVLRRQVNWLPVAEPNRKSWIESARTVHTDSLKIRIGHSDSAFAVYDQFVLKKPANKAILTAAGMPQITYMPDAAVLDFVEKNHPSTHQKREIAPEAQKIQIALFYHEDRQEDAKYVQAAVLAAVQHAYLPVNIDMQIAPDNGRDYSGPDILFLLAPQQNAEIRKPGLPGMILVSDAFSDKYESFSGRLVLPEQIGDEPVYLHKRLPTQSKGIPLWRDDFGAPILEVEKNEQTLHYRFYSRFHPDWCDLVMSESFPLWIESLLKQTRELAEFAGQNAARYDQRLVSRDQVMPRLNAAPADMQKAGANFRLHFWFWLAATLVFAVERLLSARRAI